MALGIEMLLTEEQLAERWGIASKTLANKRCNGEGPPYIKLGRLVRYDVAQIDAWLAARVRHSTSEAA